MSQSKLSLVLAWKLAAEELAAAKVKEAEAKAAAIKACFSELNDGLNCIELPRGYVFKATHYPNYRLSAEKTPAAVAAFRALGEGGQLLAQRLFKTKFEISVGEYKKLSPDGQALLSEALTVTPATPKLELVEPT